MGADYYEEVLPENDPWPVPIVFLETNYIGGYSSLKDYLLGDYNGKKKKRKK